MKGGHGQTYDINFAFDDESVFHAPQLMPRNVSESVSMWTEQECGHVGVLGTCTITFIIR